MIDAKQAVRIALKYFDEIYGDQFKNILVEEIDMSEEGPFWLITLGFNTEGPRNPIAEVLGGAPPKTIREYKIFEID
ncbi:MAG: hypothetical protein PHI18_10460, partial [bacterium]|nr:hypothetical protein [bacterium]